MRRQNLEELRAEAERGLRSSGDPEADLILGHEDVIPIDPPVAELVDWETGGVREAAYGMAAALHDEERRGVGVGKGLGPGSGVYTPPDADGFERLANTLTGRILAKAASPTHLRKVSLRGYLARARAKGENLRHLIAGCDKSIRDELTRIAREEGWL